MRNGEVQATLFWDKKRCARPGGRRDASDASDASETVRVFLLNDIDELVATADVEPYTGGIVKQIVSVAHDIDRADVLSRRRVEHEDFRGSPATDEQPVIGLVQRHRKIRLGAGHRPRTHDL